MRKFLFLSLACIALLFSCKSGDNSAGQQSAQGDVSEPQEVVESSQEPSTPTLAFDPNSLPSNPMFDIKTTMGTIRIKLYEDAPKHKENFIKLASERFFDGILFHRVIKGFMVQTGDPNTKNADLSNAEVVATFGHGGPDYTIPAEFVAGHKHIKGALAAARRGDAANPEKASSGSQFYLVQDPETCSSLDGDYTVFGETVSGLEIIDAIANVATGSLKKDLPNEPIKIISILPVTE
jgi:cyclophilin family peptidyl-prolyl cis-trans isomerase